MEKNNKEFNQECLFDLFKSGINQGAIFTQLTSIDDFIDSRKAAIFLKHDIHDLNLDKLVYFAEREAKNNIKATYFFMTLNHPRTRDSYTSADQIDAMKSIQLLGHELGLHIDPYFHMGNSHFPLAEIMKGIINSFSEYGLSFKIGNMHGNTAYKHLDNNGYGTAFDLFEEIGRQADYPVLENVPIHSADIIRKNRVSIRNFNFSYWGDMPMWSGKHGFIVTNFLTDNNLGKRQTMKLVIQKETLSAYQISQEQPPGSLNRNENGKIVPINPVSSVQQIPFMSELKLADRMLRNYFCQPESILPLLFLVHPEFYI